MSSSKVVDAQFNKAYLWMICLVAALGGFLFGYDWIVVGGSKIFYEPHFGITGDDNEFLQGWGTSSALLGCIIGALVCSFVSDRFGRKRLLILAGILFTASAIGTALAGSFAVYNWYRIVGGLGMGIALNVSPLYIAEMSPSKMRGMMVSVNQLTVMVGLLCAQIVNWQISALDDPLPKEATAECIAQTWNGTTGWRWMFAAEAVPATLFFVLMIFVPESARWLMKKGRNEEAHRVFTRLGGKAYADAEIADVSSTLPAEEIGVVRLRDLIEKHVFKVVLLGIFLSFLQQWCGMNAVFYYAADIFKAAGYEVGEIMFNIVIIGAVMTLSVLVTMALVDKVGRKRLWLIGCAVLSLVYVAIGICFITQMLGVPVVGLVLICVSVYSFTLAPLLWVILSEIYPNRIRGAAVSIVATAHWVANFILTVTFPKVNNTLGDIALPGNGKLGMAGVFFLFAAVCALGLLIARKVLPETKGKTLEDIERDLYAKN